MNIATGIKLEFNKDLFLRNKRLRRVRMVRHPMHHPLKVEPCFQEHSQLGSGRDQFTPSPSIARNSLFMTILQLLIRCSGRYLIRVLEHHVN